MSLIELSSVVAGFSESHLCILAIVSHFSVSVVLAPPKLDLAESAPSYTLPCSFFIPTHVFTQRPLSSMSSSRDVGGGVYKVGQTNNLARRIREWDRKCQYMPKVWLWAFWTPFAHRTGQ
ncbi:hypothetical protein GGU11DRAFT_751519 [Lentinula aff. detonsa]|nr:hypothetical protein GGU11DRAFT_751519 [Lentinula aff. detonsa]